MGNSSSEGRGGTELLWIVTDKRERERALFRSAKKRSLAAVGEKKV